MQSLFTVNNTVSLVSITIAPSAWWRKLLSLKRRRQHRQSAPAPPIIEEFEEETFSEEEYPPRRRHIEHTPLPPLLTDYPFDASIFYNNSADTTSSRESPKQEKPSRKQLLRNSDKRSSSSSRPMAAATTLTAIGPPEQLDASLDDFAPSMGNPPRLPFGYPSAHSGFRSDDTMSETAASEVSEASAGGYSPPAWRRLGNGDRSSGFWRKGDDLMNLMYDGDELDLEDVGIGHSRESSPEYESADEGDEILAQAIRTRLPTGSLSPEKERSPEPEYYPAQQHLIDDVVNVFRFAVRAEVQHRTEPIETAINFIRRRFRAVTNSWSSMLLSFIIATLSYAALRWVSQPAAMRPVPDLVKVAGVARSLEPLIYYSENGIQQVGDLQATGVAVWDLGESVRSSNLTSAPIIVKELDELSDSLKTLAIELTKFFANVDGDIDGVLITLHRTFHEFLTVLEDAVASELQHSLALFALFEAIDHQFLNLARTVVRESSLQDEAHGELLSSLWTRILGANQNTLAKYERNRLLLQNVREKTVRNKGILVEHNHKLLALKANLESLRRKLVSPLVRSVNGSTLTLEEQIRGLEDVGGYLERADGVLFGFKG
ncbi:hypothetical protein N0V88_005458 [Collariella sp. IMI 366227]|nr:hypothetical protein N0V88_005458 [Collariella sp. IMI 366227]